MGPRPEDAHGPIMSDGSVAPGRAPLDVFLVPVSADQHEPYCESEDDLDDPAGDGSPRGWWEGLQQRFRHVLAAAERERVRSAEEREALRRTWPGRLRGRALRWIAERVAEQRLLWHLRRQCHACLVHAADVSPDEAVLALRKALQRDAGRHRRWLVIDGVLLALSGVLTVVPGPNVLAIFFGFRVVAHYLSWRGARQGLEGIAWTTRASAELADLRRVIDLPPHERERHVHDIAARLQLEHLPRFFARMAAWGA